MYRVATIALTLATITLLGASCVTSSPRLATNDAHPTPTRRPLFIASAPAPSGPQYIGGGVIGMVSSPTNTVVSQATSTAQITSSCTTVSCFRERFDQCTPGAILYSQIMPNLAYHYQIVGPRDGGCAMTTYYPKNPNIGWVGLPMTCTYDNTDPFEQAAQAIMHDLSSCTGLLAAAILDLPNRTNATADPIRPNPPITSQTAAERGVVRVSVVHDGNKLPIPGAMITIPNSSLFFVTNSDGWVEISAQYVVAVPARSNIAASTTYTLKRYASVGALEIRVKAAPVTGALIFPTVYRHTNTDGITRITGLIKSKKNQGGYPGLTIAFANVNLSAKTESDGSFMLEVPAFNTNYRIYFPEIGGGAKPVYYHLDVLSGLTHEVTIELE